jgi:N-acyl-D-aspartate/D-glutamate deacylase
MHDLVIRNGIVFDGNGGPSMEADVAIDGDRIAAIGEVSTKGSEEIDAKGQIVTPGFVDVHTHFDGQVTWDPYLQPSTFHGVTTVIMGNCGVGFAPCKPERREWLIGLMEGVEDIPGTALAEGIKWNWESFPEFIDAVEASPLAIDVGLQVPHGALRGYVMGERATRLEPATEDDSEQMAALVAEALEAGALGFSTSRTEKHRDRNGNHTPSFKAEQFELHSIARAMGKAGGNGLGVIQLIADYWDFEPEFEMIRGMVEVSGRPLSMTIEQDDRHPEIWQKVLSGITEAAERGLPIKGQVPARPTCVLQGLTTTLNPFLFHATYQEINSAPLEEKLAALRDPEWRRRLLAEPRPDLDPDSIVSFLIESFHKMYEMGDPPNYEPDPSDSIAARAEREGRDPRELLLDIMEKDEGKAFLYFPIMNYMNGNLDDVRTMLTHPHTTFGLGDAGAHCGVLCDASFPTTHLIHWGRDRSRGEKLPLEWIIRKQTRESAELVGLADRGVLAEGMKADVNVIDFDHLQLHAPRIVYDLPAGGKRLIQTADGYTASIVSGAVAFRDGQPTGAPLGGRLVRGAQQRPAAVKAA